jgi:uncharacterized membrane protein YkoI
MSKTLAIVLLLILYFVSGNLYARHDIAIQLESDGKVLALEKIVTKARLIHEGRVIEAEISTENNRYVYDVEILDEDGVLWDLKFNAKDGELKESSKEE